jgi:hypothetical protein
MALGPAGLSGHNTYISALMRVPGAPGVVSDGSAQSESEDDDMQDDHGAATAVIPRPRRTDHCPYWCDDHDDERNICATTSRLNISDPGPASAVRSIDVHLTAEPGSQPRIQLCFNDGGDNDLGLKSATSLVHMILHAYDMALRGAAS